MPEEMQASRTIINLIEPNIILQYAVKNVDVINFYCC